MEEKLKIVVLVLAVLLAGSLFIIFGIQNSRLTLLREYTSTKQELTRSNEEIGNNLNSALAENNDLKDRLEVIQRNLERISSEKNQIQQSYELVKKEKESLLKRLEELKPSEQLQSDFESLKDENKTLKQQVVAVKKQRLSLESELNELRQKNEGFRQKVIEAKQILKEKPFENKYVKAQKFSAIQKSKARSVDLPLISVSAAASSGIIPSFSPAEGKILNTNTEYSFVVIDLGRKEGIREGMIFNVLRDEKLLGKIKVIQLRADVAACDLMQVSSPFKIGDIVRY